jgi:phosphoribosylformimino-5-aminoimidazole carboxamide ribotide isomerase
MELIPVIDLMDGLVVHAVRGIRAEYRPIESLIAHDAMPTTVARAFADLGFAECYVADLNAIEGNSPNWQAFDDIRRAGLHLWIDSGIQSSHQAIALSQRTDCRVVLGSESCASMALVRETIAAITADRVIVSLDMKAGRVLSRIPDWRSISPDDAIRQFTEASVERLILLDLDRVGTESGMESAALAVRIKQWHRSVRIYIGGGIRSDEDLVELERAGCTGALVSTALHRRRLTCLHRS